MRLLKPLTNLCVFAYLLAYAALFLFVPAAEAQEPVRLALFPSASADAALQKLAAALNKVVLSRLSEISQVQVAAQPALDLPATQLASDCVGETRECMLAIAQQANAEGLLAPSLQLAGDETVVTFLYFDPRGPGELRNVTRRYRGENIEKQALDGVPAALNELLGVEAAVPAPVHDSRVETSYDETAEPPEPRAFPVVPVVITAVGVALVAGGIAFGLAANASEDEYARLGVTSMAEAQAASDKLDSAKTQALLSNIGFVAGGGVIALGVTLLVLQLSDEPERQSASLAPNVAPGEVGLTLRGHWL